MPFGVRRSLAEMRVEVERVQRGSELVAHDEVGQRLALGLERGVLVGRAGEADEVERPVRRRSGAVDLAVGDLLAEPERALPDLLVTVDRRPLHPHPAGEDVGGPEQRLLQEVGGLEDRRRRCPARRPVAGHHPVRG